jgi:hypothetical protein
MIISIARSVEMFFIFFQVFQFLSNLTLFFMKFCFEISARETGGMIKACKTDSEGKVVEGTV